jgi:hypothetical protein
MLVSAAACSTPRYSALGERPFFFFAIASSVFACSVVVDFAWKQLKLFLLLSVCLQPGVQSIYSFG